jgi:endoglucanase
MDEVLSMLKELTEAQGVPGYEAPVRAVVRRYLGPLGDLSQDKVGSVICCQVGQSEAPRVMLAGHMDEIGFMVRHIHSHSSIIHREDYDQAAALLVALLKKLDAATVASFTA